MGIMETLFATDIGLLSMFTIGFVIVIAIFFIIWTGKKMDEPPQED